MPISRTFNLSAALCIIAYCSTLHTLCLTDSVQPLNKSPDGGQNMHCCCSDMPTLTLLSVCVQDLSSSRRSPFQRQITCPTRCSQNSEVQQSLQALHALQRRGSPTIGILHTLCGGETQADKQKGSAGRKP